jgi:CheY-like chemotaxis protein
LLENHPEESVRRKVDVIRASAWRAIDMVKQILSFVKGREARASQVTLSNLLREMEKMARITFPKSIDIETDLVNTTTLRAVAGDPTELHQVLLNLCVNARDAMPSGGRLILSAQNIELTPEDAAALGGKPGPHVKISVADTGTGIAPEVLPRIFEPFFTTKLPDRGTGLGLSTVAGIVKRHGGCLDVKTTLGRGTEFQVYLPAAEQPELVTVTPERTPMPGGRGETILVIEDEEALLELTKEALETYGYNVVTAHNGTQGIARFEEAREKIKLVVTDTDMREMDGLTAARAIREMNPGLPVIIASGTQHDTSQLRRIEADKMVNLGKPYSLEQLLLAVASNIK